MTTGEKIEEYIWKWFKMNKFPGIYTSLDWEDKTGCQINFEEQYHQNYPSPIGDSTFYYNNSVSLYEQWCEITKDWNCSTKMFSFPELTERQFYTDVLKESSENLLLLV